MTSQTSYLPHADELLCRPVNMDVFAFPNVYLERDWPSHDFINSVYDAGVVEGIVLSQATDGTISVRNGRCRILASQIAFAKRHGYDVRQKSWPTTLASLMAGDKLDEIDLDKTTKGRMIKGFAYDGGNLDLTAWQLITNAHASDNFLTDVEAIISATKAGRGTIEALRADTHIPTGTLKKLMKIASLDDDFIQGYRAGAVAKTQLEKIATLKPATQKMAQEKLALRVAEGKNLTHDDVREVTETQVNGALQTVAMFQGLPSKNIQTAPILYGVVKGAKTVSFETEEIARAHVEKHGGTLYEMLPML